MGAVNAFRKLDDVDKPQIIIGAGASIETLAIGKLANDNEIILLTPVSSAAEISSLGHSFSELSDQMHFKRTCWPSGLLESGYSQVSVLFLNSSWRIGLKDHFTANLNG